jgi:hypothetical protein
MRFERDLKPYAEYVRIRELKNGHVYYTVGFADEAMLIPSLEPVVYIGSDVAFGVEKAYFQNICAYQYGMRFDPANEKDAWAFQAIEVGKNGEINGVCHYEQALEVLMRCSLRRTKAASAV